MENSKKLLDLALKIGKNVDKTLDSFVEVWKTAWIVLKTLVWKTFHGVENLEKIFCENKQIAPSGKCALGDLQGWIGKRERL